MTCFVCCRCAEGCLQGAYAVKAAAASSKLNLNRALPGVWAGLPQLCQHLRPRMLGPKPPSPCRRLGLWRGATGGGRPQRRRHVRRGGRPRLGRGHGRWHAVHQCIARVHRGEAAPVRAAAHCARGQGLRAGGAADARTSAWSCLSAPAWRSTLHHHPHALHPRNCPHGRCCGPRMAHQQQAGSRNAALLACAAPRPCPPCPAPPLDPAQAQRA